MKSLKKTLVGALVALTLFASPAYASDAFFEPDGDPGSCIVFQAKNQGVGSVEVARLCNATGGPDFDIQSEDLEIDGVAWQTHQDAKADASDVATLEDNVAASLSDHETRMDGMEVDIEDAALLADTANSAAADASVAAAQAQSEVDTLEGVVAGKADASHNHDSRYYTETEVDAALATKANSSHTHTASQISDSTTTGRAVLTASTQAAARSAIGAGTSSLGTGASVTDAATNAATNAPTNLNVVTTLLGSLTGEVNATNAKQNDLATKYNDLATKYNSLLNMLEAQNLPAAN